MESVDLKNKALNVALLIFAVFPLIPNNLKGFPVILLTIVSVFFYKKKQIEWKWLLINSSLYIVYLVTLIYTDNYSYALKKLETGLSILLIPMIFYIFLPKFLVFDGNNVKTRFYKVFVISTTIFSLLLLISILFDDSTIYYKDWYTNKFRVITLNTPLIGQHPIYASIFISLALIFYIELLRLKTFNSGFQIFIYSFITLINLSFLIMLLSKGVIISLVIIVFLIIIRDKRLRSYRSLFLFSMIAFFIFLFTYNRRMNELLRTETYNEISSNYSTGIRIGIYQCSLDAIKESWFFGYGLGDTQDELNKCYLSKSDLLYKEEYNTHNQYFDVLMKAGILGLIVFLYFLFININEAIKSKNQIALLVLLFYAINLLTENVLARQSGVILFFFLICFLGFYKVEKAK